MSRYVRLAALTIAAAAILALAAGCGSSSNKESTGGQAGAPTAVPTAGSTSYPLKLVDMLNRDVTIQARPQRILAISPTTLELVYAVGGTSIGRVSSATKPDEAQSLPVVGSAYRPNSEQILQLNPDLILADSVLQPSLRDQLDALKVPVVYVGAPNLQGVMQAERMTAQVVGTPPAGEAAVQRLQAKVDELRAKITVLAALPTVLIVNGAANDFYVAKPDSYVGDLVQTLAAQNVAAGLKDVGPFPGYTKLSIEQIVADNPDVILGITAGPPGDTITKALAGNPGWDTISAVKNNRVFEIPVDIFLQAPGPRAEEGLDMLAGYLYPDVFKQQ